MLRKIKSALVSLSDKTEISNLPIYKRGKMGISYLPQEASIFRGMTVEANIRAVAEVVEPNKKVRDELVESLLQEFNIQHLRESFIG